MNSILWKLLNNNKTESSIYLAFFSFFLFLFLFFFLAMQLGQQGDQTSQSYRKSTLNIHRIDAEAEGLILCLLDAKSQLFGKDPDARKDWGQEEKEATEDEMVGWHHQFNGHELSKWRTGKPDALQSTGSQIVRHSLGMNNNNAASKILVPQPGTKPCL